eukprot:g652.t1
MCHIGTFLLLLLASSARAYKLTEEDEPLNAGVFEAYDAGFVGYYGVESESTVLPNGTTLIDASDATDIRIDTGVWTHYNPNVMYAHGIGDGLDDQVTQSCPGQVTSDDGQQHFCRGETFGVCDRRNGVCWCKKNYTGPACAMCSSEYYEKNKTIHFLGEGYCADVDSQEIPFVSLDPAIARTCSVLCQSLTRCIGLSHDSLSVDENRSSNGCRLYFSEDGEEASADVLRMLDSIFSLSESRHVSLGEVLDDMVSNADWISSAGNATSALSAEIRDALERSGRLVSDTMRTQTFGPSQLCAEEGEACRCPRGGVVRYGIENRWSEWQVQDDDVITCSDAHFDDGRDPAPGVHKQCECRIPVFTRWIAPDNLTRRDAVQSYKISKTVVAFEGGGPERSCYAKMPFCSKKKKCPNDCSGGGTCDHATGTCTCFEYRTGTDCATSICQTFSPMCDSCTVEGCVRCKPSYFLDANRTCASCAATYDPRCITCDATACLACADSLLNSVRRSGKRHVDDEVLTTIVEENRRQLSATLAFGSQRPEFFSDVESDYVVIDGAYDVDNLAAFSKHCTQMLVYGERGRFHSWWQCESTSSRVSNVVCGHVGTLQFSSPTYEVREDALKIPITVERTGGGYGSVSVGFGLKHVSTNDDDVSLTEIGWISEAFHIEDASTLSSSDENDHTQYPADGSLSSITRRLHFEPGVVKITFHISIVDDIVLEGDETFQIFLHSVEGDAGDHDTLGGGHLGPQSMAMVTILDDDLARVSTTVSTVTGTGLREGTAGEVSEIVFELLSPSGESVSLSMEEQLELHMSTMTPDGPPEDFDARAREAMVQQRELLEVSDTWAWLRPPQPILSPTMRTEEPRAGLYVDFRYPSLDPPAGIDVSWERFECVPDDGEDGETRVRHRCTFTPRHAGTYFLHLSLGKSKGLIGEYYDNAFLDGNPVMTRRDRQVLFYWGDGLITPRARNFVSVRWTGQIVNPFVESMYTFFVTADDHVRVWLDHRLIIDAWDDAKPNATRSRSVVMLLGWHDIQVEYRDVGGNAFIALEWESREFDRTPIPQQAFRSLHPFGSSPHAVHVQPTSLEPRQTLASGGALSNMQASKAYNVELLACDRFGNERGRSFASEDSFTAVADLRGDADFLTTHPSVVTGASFYNPDRKRHVLPLQMNLAGTYALDIVGSHPDTQQLEPIFSGHSFGLDVEPGRADGLESVVWGDAVRHLETTDQIGVATAGESAMFEIELRDALSNKLRNGGDILEVTLVHTATGTMVRGHVIGSSDHSAEYEIRYTPKLSGASLLSLRCVTCIDRSAHVLGSPFPVHVFPGTPLPESCTASGTALRYAVEGVPTTFQVQIRDVHGNQLLDYASFATELWSDVADLTPLVAARISNTGEVPPENIVYVGNGAFNVTYTASGSGVQELSVTVNGASIAASPFDLHVLDGSTHSDLCQISEFGKAVASVPSPMRLRLADGSNNTRTAHIDDIRRVLEAGGRAANVLYEGLGVRLEAFDHMSAVDVNVSLEIVSATIRGLSTESDRRWTKCRNLVEPIDPGSWHADAQEWRTVCLNDAHETISPRTLDFDAVSDDDGRVPLIFDVLYVINTTGDWSIETTVVESGTELGQIERSPFSLRVFPDRIDPATSDADGCERHIVAGTNALMSLKLRDRAYNRQVQRGNVAKMSISCELRNMLVTGRESRQSSVSSDVRFERRHHYAPLRQDASLLGVLSTLRSPQECVDQCSKRADCAAIEFDTNVNVCRMYGVGYAQSIEDVANTVTLSVFLYVKLPSSSEDDLLRPGATLNGAPMPRLVIDVDDFVEDDAVLLQGETNYDIAQWSGTLVTRWRPTVAGSWRCDPIMMRPGGLKGRYFYSDADYERALAFPRPDRFGISHNDSDGSLLAARSRVDHTIHFDWTREALADLSAPRSFDFERERVELTNETQWGPLEWDQWAVRWDGFLRPSYTELYVLEVETSVEDSVRLWIDDAVLISVNDRVRLRSEPHESRSSTIHESNPINLRAGFAHSIRLDFRDLGHNASIALRWSSPSQRKEIVSSDHLWYVERFGNASFRPTVHAASTDPAVSIARSVISRTSATGHDNALYDALSVVVAGEKWSFVVEARDFYGNRRTVGGDQLVVVLRSKHDSESETHSLTGIITDNEDGSYTVSYTPRFAGKYAMTVAFADASWPIVEGSNSNSTALSAAALDLAPSHLHVLANGRHVDISPFELRVLPSACSGSLSFTSGDATHYAVAGNETSFTVHLRDRLDNPCSSANTIVTAQLWHRDVSLQVPHAVFDCTVERVEDQSDAVRVTYDPVISGVYELRVSLVPGIVPGFTDSQSIADSPFALTVHPAPIADADQTTLEGLMTEIGMTLTAGRERILTVTSRDRFGNIRSSGGDVFGIVLDGVSRQVVGDISDNSDGTYAIRCVPADRTLRENDPSESSYAHILRVVLAQNPGVRASYFVSSDSMSGNTSPPNAGGGVVTRHYDRLWGTVGGADVIDYMPTSTTMREETASAGWLRTDIVASIDDSNVSTAGSVRWEGFLRVPTSEVYTFEAELVSADDGVRLRIGEHSVLDDLWENADGANATNEVRIAS